MKTKLKLKKCQIISIHFTNPFLSLMGSQSCWSLSCPLLGEGGVQPEQVASSLQGFQIISLFKYAA